MRRCTTARYPDRPRAIAAKRTLLREMRLQSIASFCQECNNYHLVANVPVRLRMNNASITILECLAKGYRDAETSTIVNESPRTVESKIIYMMRRFDALSRPHLVAITIALGILDPNSFVPEEVERIHA